MWSVRRQLRMQTFQFYFRKKQKGSEKFVFKKTTKTKKISRLFFNLCHHAIINREALGNVCYNGFFLFTFVSKWIHKKHRCY